MPGHVLGSQSVLEGSVHLQAGFVNVHRKGLKGPPYP